MNKTLLLAMGLLCAMFLAACGSSTKDFVNGQPGGSSQNSKTKVTLLPSLSSETSEMGIALPVENGYVVGLARGGMPVKVPFANISSVGWNDGCKGWRASGGNGVFVKLDPNNNTVIKAINTGGSGNWSVIEKGGRESFFNLDALAVSGSQFLIANNAFVYGTAVKVVGGVTVVNDDFSCPATDAPTIAQTSKYQILLDSASNAMKVVLPLENGNVTNLSRGGVPVKVPFANISSVGWNDGCKGWRASGGNGVFVKLDSSNNTVIKGVDLGGAGNWSVLEKGGGRESFVNLDALSVTGGQFLVASNTFFYGSAVTRNIAGALVVDDNFSCVSANTSTPQIAINIFIPKTIVNVNTALGQVEITPVITNGKLLNLVSSNQAEQVLDVNGQLIAGYRLVWNDNGDWYPAAGKISALQLPKTTITQATKPVGFGVGMPYLVRPNGTYTPFNTDPTVMTFTVNGVLTKVNVDGLMPY